MRNFLLIHGSYSNHSGNWFKWLEEFLKQSGEQVCNVDYPTSPDLVKASELQNYKNWEEILNLHKDFINEDTIFIGHSISCIFFVKYAILNNIKIHKSIMISGFNNYNENFTDFIVNLKAEKVFLEAMKSFYLDDISKFKKLCDNRICFYSDNDPIISKEKLIEFPKLIDAETVVVKDAGHFCDGKYGKELIEIMDELEIENKTCLNG